MCVFVEIKHMSVETLCLFLCIIKDSNARIFNPWKFCKSLKFINRQISFCTLKGSGHDHKIFNMLSGILFYDEN